MIDTGCGQARTINYKAHDFPRPVEFRACSGRTSENATAEGSNVRFNLHGTLDSKG